MSIVRKLVELGFERKKAEIAIKETKHESIGAALQWLINIDRRDPSHGNCDAGEGQKIVKKQFRQTLTIEQRKAKLKLLDRELKQKRLEREARERIVAQQREKKRIKTNKDLAKNHRKLQELQAKEILEQKERDAIAERIKHKRLCQKIEAKKAERKENATPRVEKPSSIAAPATTPSKTFRQSDVSAVKKCYTHTNIQVRLLDGSTIRQTFRVSDPLSVVRAFIKRKTDIDHPYKLITNFPRRVFGENAFRKSLKDLGLVPTAVVIMVKSDSLKQKITTSN